MKSDSLAAAPAWGRRQTAADWLALGAGLAVFAYVGWDAALWQPQLQLVLHLLAIGAVGGVLAVGLRGGLLPRTALDLPLLALLAAFALATASALNPGMSLRAMGSITAFAAMLPVALLVLRRRPAWLALVVCVPVLVLSAIGLAALLARRVEWYLAGAPGLLPPIRLPAEGTPFGSVAVAPFIISAVLPLSLLIGPARVRGMVQGALLALGVPLTILSGSRSAWLAIGVATVVFVAPVAWRQRHRLRYRGEWTARRLAVAGVALLGVAAAAVLVAPRLTAVTSLIYRGALWRDTLAAWSVDPLLGLGPGIMPYARQAAAPALSLPVRQPHSHNLPLGVLGDAGIVGLLGAFALAAAFFWFAGPWRSRSIVGRASGSTLAGFAIAGLFEDLTFLPNFNLLVILLVAIALADAGAVRWAPLPRLSGWRRAGGMAAAAAIGGVLLLGMVVADAGALAYR
ncbi:MAG: O-antigen ligase family protein, partial [Thermoleophilaceae bacterium]